MHGAFSINGSSTKMTQAMTYDLNGNTLNDGTNAYVWDARNRLVSGRWPGHQNRNDP